jgi:MrfA Zn-binding domain
VTQPYPVRVGDLRPSQLLWSNGCGSVVDLPQVSVIVMGLNYWDPMTCVPVGEDRLLTAVRRVLGPQVTRLLGPPIRPTEDGPLNPFSPEARIGIPVSPFPRWLRCPLCGRMGEVGSGLFELKSNAFRPDRTRFVHSNCDRAKGSPPPAVPARFLVACRGGHIDDFPWHYFVHVGHSDCPGPLRFFEQGASLQTENLWVRCEREGCGKSRSMVDAFGDRGAELLPKCRGRHPHLGRAGHSCDERLRPVLLGASNSWFPVTLTVLAIPTRANRLQQMIQDKWELFEGITSREILPKIIEVLVKTAAVPGLGEHSLDEIWEAIEELRSSTSGSGDDNDLKGPEWEVFTSPKPPQNWPDFMVTRIEAPNGFKSHLDYVVLAERLREVNALVGFTRVEPPEEVRAGSNPPTRAPLSNDNPEWIPTTEVRGEGIFVRFKSETLSAWLARPLVRDREVALLQGHKSFRAARNLTPLEADFPGILYILLHSFAHIFIRELALESGYSAASVRERIYAAGYGEAPDVAGVLIYTAAADSDGTLGGLVELGKTENLGRLIKQALERTRICASDPLCSEHTPTHDRSLHGAACHACTFVAETSCEIGNRYLDRSLIVPTLAGSDLAFFN